MNDLPTTDLRDESWDPLDWSEEEIREELRLQRQSNSLERGEDFTDDDFVGFERDDFLKDFTKILWDISTEGRYFVESPSAGRAVVTAGSADEFISKLFPSATWVLHGKYYERRRLLQFTLAGEALATEEFYTVRAATVEEEP